MVSRRRYVLTRFALMVVTLYVIATILFILFRTLPGDPSLFLIDPQTPKEQQEAILEQYGLNDPLHVQYYKFMENIVTLDLGKSFSFGADVNSLLVEATFNTMVLILGALTLAFTLGTMLGALLAWRRRSRLDRWGVIAVLIFFAAPVFWTAMIALSVFAFNLGWVPGGGMRSAAATYEGFFGVLLSVDFLWHYILPLTITSLYWLPRPTLIMRSNMIDILGADFIELTRAEGLPELRILYRHAMRNSLLPVFHYSAVAIALGIGGSVVVETVFSWPGVGRMLWQAVKARDYPLAQGGFLMIATMIVSLNFLVDVLSTYIDPRATEESESGH